MYYFKKRLAAIKKDFTNEGIAIVESDVTIPEDLETKRTGYIQVSY